MTKFVLSEVCELFRAESTLVYAIGAMSGFMVDCIKSVVDEKISNGLFLFLDKCL